MSPVDINLGSIAASHPTHPLGGTAVDPVSAPVPLKTALREDDA